VLVAEVEDLVPASSVSATKAHAKGKAGAAAAERGGRSGEGGGNGDADERGEAEEEEEEIIRKPKSSGRAGRPRRIIEDDDEEG